MKVLIAAPLRQSVEIFREYQDSLDRLELPDGVTADRFFVVNDCPGIIPEIRDADYIVNDSANVTMYQNHLWTNDLVSKMSIMRNQTIQRALDGGYDYLLSADTDLVLHPETLKVLIGSGKTSSRNSFGQTDGRMRGCTTRPRTTNGLSGTNQDCMK